mmetsp:Transcript_7413/g.30673  ORF Transcript_7413/g.30673 Transcript_7413/m.30673 type:complete len:333 (-) Transcript_7413:264-1262(-)
MRELVSVANGVDQQSTGLLAVQFAVDRLGDRPNLGRELGLDAVQVEAVLEGDEIDGETEVAEAAGAADAVQVRLGGLGQVEVDDDVDGLDVDAAREKVRRDEVARRALAKLVEDAVAVGLLHLGVDVEARVAHLGDFFGEQLDARDRVAKDDRLVDLEFGEERVQARHFLALLDEGVELRDALEREVVHEVDFVRVLDPAILEVLDRHRERRREQADLAALLAVRDELLDERLELGREELVGLVHDQRVALRQPGDTLIRQVEDAARRADEHVHGLVEPHDVVLERRPARAHHALDVEVLADFFHDGRRLQREPVVPKASISSREREPRRRQ